MRALADLVARWRTPTPHMARTPAEQDACVLCGTSTAPMAEFDQDGVCDNCGYHHALSARARIALLADPGSFRETHASTTAIDPLSFDDEGRYRKQLREAFRRTGLREAVITGTCRIHERPAMLIVLDFGFLGGSMGVVVGERVARAFEDATKRKLPVISIISSSGMRMQEGLLALLQMPKTAAAARRHHRGGLAHFVILGNPSTGGVYASFANLADVMIGEPAALVGFASLRVVEQLEGKALPPEAHTAEAHLAHGLIDLVVTRRRQRDLLVSLLDLTAPTFRLELTRPLEPLVRRTRPPATPFQEVELARHEQRPSALDYIGRIAATFVEIRGDRTTGDDAAVVAGFANLGGEAVMLIGQQRSEAAHRPPTIQPAGFRKAARAMRLAEKFNLPVIALIDTRGALASREAEEHGVGNAMADCLATASELKTPILAIIIGEGGSEAAIAFGHADRVLMLEHAVFSIASPEAAATALYRDASRAGEVADALRLTAFDAQDLGVVDRIIPEPLGGAHKDHDAAAAALKAAVLQDLTSLCRTRTSRLLRDRYRKYRRTRGYQNFFRVSLGRNLTDLRASLGAGRRRLLPRFGRSRHAHRHEPDDEIAEIPVD